MTTTTDRISEFARRDSEIIRLQGRLLDHTGHVRRGLTRDDTRALISEIDFLRERNGWAHLDMSGRWYPRGLPETTT